MENKVCRFCGKPLIDSFVDLGMSPLSNSYIKTQNLYKKENFYPLHAYVCTECFLVQLEEFETPKVIFNDYAYFSSYSNSWLVHSRKYADMMISKFNFNSQSQVIEIASNDGYLLQYFKDNIIKVLGIEPAKNVAEVAIKKGIPTITEFFGQELAEKLVSKGNKADLLIGNNVLAHVPDLNDFVAGMKIILKPQGIITMEFPHLLKLMQQNQFDTIYHEHFSYFSFISTQQILFKHGLTIFDVEEINTHGGSLRIFVKHVSDNSKKVSKNVEQLLDKEKKYGLNCIITYKNFKQKVEKSKRNILKFFIQAKEKDKTIVGYGAPAKGNTLLNYCGIGRDFFDYTVDRNFFKQGSYLPGTHIPIFSPDKIKETRPDYVVILPWNIKEEIMEQMAYIKEWGGKFIVLIPEVEVL